MGALLLAEAPALPLHEAGKYVAGAYIVLFVLVLVYVAIMAVRLSRIERELGTLLEHMRAEERATRDASEELRPLEDATTESTPV
jgi:CcmD family protein